MKIILKFTLSIIFLSCIQKNEREKNYAITNIDKQEQVLKHDSLQVINLGTGKKYKFKGMAITANKAFGYFGSWNKKEIVKINLKDKTVKVLNTPYNGKLNGMGTYIKNGKLYAVMNEISDKVNSKAISVLLVFDLKVDKLIKAYEISENTNGRHHFNHIVVDKTGTAYISNTIQSSIYTVNTENSNDTLRLFIKNKELAMIHGLDLSLNESKLFCTSYSGGIKIIDLKSEKILPYSNPKENQNDGLIYRNGFLYGVGGNTIKQYKLNHEETKIIDSKIILKDHFYFNDPRCLQIIDKDLYCLANIEIEPVTFRRLNKKSRKNPLNDSHIIKIKI